MAPDRRISGSPKGRSSFDSADAGLRDQAMTGSYRGIRGIHRQSLTGPVIDLCGITALLVAAMFTLMLVSLEHLRSDQAKLGRSSDLLTQAAQIEGSVLDMETGLRGYLLSDNRVFLQPYNQAKATVPHQLAELASLSDGPREAQQVAQIHSAVGSYITDFAEPLVAKGPHLRTSQEITEALHGKSLVDGIRQRFTALENIDRALRGSDRARTDAESNQAVLFGAIGLGLSVLLLVGLAAYLVTRFLGPMRNVATAARQLAAGRLDTRVPEVGIGEVAELGRSFNAMAADLESHEQELSATHARLERALEEAHSASKLKSNFLANMSHEIRTPLNGLVGSMELLAETPLNREQEEFVELARSSGEALLTVVSDVLDIAKIESGRVEIEERDFDLYDAVEGACDVVAAAASNKGLELQSLIEVDVPPLVRGDRVRVSQILTNLLSNAVKFTSHGEVTLQVSVVARAGSQAKLLFDVTDTGIGIEQENLARLFEPFTQADAGTTRTYGGTGLGLTIARELTTMMHGSLRVQSMVGKGSRFQFELPFTVPEVGQGPLLVPDELQGLHVLIVDANATNRRIFGTYLSNWRMRPATADTAPSGLAHLEFAVSQGDAFDLVLIDDQLGQSSGLDLARQIATNPLLGQIPIILLSHSAQTTNRDLAGGIVGLVRKPVRQSKLLDAVTRTIRKVGAAEGADGQAGAEPGKLPGRRILVAEDHTVNWMLVERFLTRRGHLAVNATNGEQVLARVQEEEFDLVLMDCQMPVLDGYETTRQLRRRESGTRDHIPVVAMTAHAMQGDRERCLAAGMDDYLAKPITSAALDAVLERWLPADSAPPRPLDQTRMKELRTLFPGEETAETIAQLQADVDEQLQRLAGALRAGRRDQAAQAAHRIKGSAYMVGARRLAEAAAQLQAAAEADPKRAEEAEHQLRDQWKLVSAALDDERSSGGSPTARASTQ
jgi:two-component system sensor histidine kinase/response regulator